MAGLSAEAMTFDHDELMRGSASHAAAADEGERLGTVMMDFVARGWARGRWADEKPLCYQRRNEP